MWGWSLDQLDVIDIRRMRPGQADPNDNSVPSAEDSTTDTTEELETPERQVLSLDVPPLPAEVESSYVDGLVTVHTSVKQAYPDLRGSNCTGTVMENGWVLTAAHCIRRVSGENDAEMRVTTADGDDVRDRIWVARNGQEFTATADHFFVDYDNGENKSLDIAVLEVDDALESGISPLPFAPPESLERGTPLYLYSRFGQPDARTYGGIILELPTHGVPHIQVGFRVDGQDNNASSPGASGTSVVTAVGDIAGINLGTNTFSDGQESVLITSDVARQYGLAETTVNQRLAICSIAPGSLAMELLD
jgi:hypothetical protein